MLVQGNLEIGCGEKAMHECMISLFPVFSFVRERA